jgi:hypothetical protein
MSNFKFLTDNFIDPDIVSNSTVSSEQTAFPVSNVYNFARRSKVWRSNGFFEITSLNNKIVFQEYSTGGPGWKTATLTIGAYASTALMCAEIKSALELIGDSTYTITQDPTTLKFKFISNGAGGNGAFSIQWPNSSISMATGATFGFSPTELSGSLTYYADEISLSTGEWIKWDFGISTNPKAFVLIGPRNKPIKISPSATLKLQGNETDVWTNSSYQTTLVYNDSVIYVLSDIGLHTEALRYWRLSIEDIHNPNGYVEIGALFLGDYFSPTTGSIQFPFNGQYIDNSSTIFSEGGQTFSDIREKTEGFSFVISFLTVAEKQELDLAFSSIGLSYPFFVILDPNMAYSSSINYMIRYVKFSSSPSYQLTSPGVFSANIELREEL